VAGYPHGQCHRSQASERLRTTLEWGNGAQGMLTPFRDDPDYEQFCHQELQNPYPLFARLRERDPVHWCEPMHMWLVTRHEDVRTALRDTERLPSSRRRMYTDPLPPEKREAAQPLVEHISLWLQNLNPPQHTRLRTLVNLAFTPRMLKALAPRIEQIVDQLLDSLRGRDRVDFVATFCFPLPAMVICEMLGIPEADGARYRQAVEQLIPFSSGGGPGLAHAVDPARRALEELLAYFDGLIAERRARPQGDLISAMTAAEADGDRLSREELFGLCVFLYVAGHETTASLLSSGTRALLEHPEQFDRLRADPDGRVEGAVEEFLRYESPVTRAVRVPGEDFEWRGRTIRQGETITLLIGAANRDPAVFDDPDRLDIARHPNRHLGFGQGIHFCLGAPLARLEGQIAFRAIARRLPGMRLCGGELRYRPALGIRSLESLPVTGL
jgi:cytochrome P450